MANKNKPGPGPEDVGELVIPEDHDSMLRLLLHYQELGAFKLPDYEVLLDKLLLGEDPRVVPAARSCLLRHAGMTSGAMQCSTGGYALARAFRTQLGLILEPHIDGLSPNVQSELVKAVSYALATQLLLTVMDLLTGTEALAIARRGSEVPTQSSVCLDVIQQAVADRLRHSVTAAAKPAQVR